MENLTGISAPVRPLPCVVPCKLYFEEQNEIVDYLDNEILEIEQMINKKEQFLMEVEFYKKSMIYEYITGKKEAI